MGFHQKPTRFKVPVVEDESDGIDSTSIRRNKELTRQKWEKRLSASGAVLFPDRTLSVDSSRIPQHSENHSVLQVSPDNEPYENGDYEVDYEPDIREEVNMPIYKLPVIYHQVPEKTIPSSVPSPPIPASPPPTLNNYTDLPEADREQEYPVEESIIAREIRLQRDKERSLFEDGTLKVYNGYPKEEEESEDSHSEVTPSVIQLDIEQLKAKEDEYYRQRERIESEKTMLSPVNKQGSPRGPEEDHHEKITTLGTSDSEVFGVTKMEDLFHDSGCVFDSGPESSPPHQMHPSNDDSSIEASPPQPMPSYIDTITHSNPNKAESLIAREIRELEEREAELRNRHREMTPRSGDDRSSQTAPADQLHSYDKPVHSQPAPLAYSQPTLSAVESRNQETIVHTASPAPYATQAKAGSTPRSLSVESELNKDNTEPFKKQSQPRIRKYGTEPVPVSTKKTQPSFSSTRHADTSIPSYNTYSSSKTGNDDMLPIEPEKAGDDLADGYAESTEGSTRSEPISVQPPYEPVDADFPFMTLQSNPVDREIQIHRKRVDEENDVRKQAGLPLLESLPGFQTFSEVVTAVKSLKDWKSQVDAKKNVDLKRDQDKRLKRLSTIMLQREIEQETSRDREVEKQHEGQRHQPPVKTEQDKTDGKSAKAAEKTHTSSPNTEPQKDSKTTKPTQNGELGSHTQATSSKSNKSTVRVTPQPSKAEPEVTRRYSAQSHETVYRKPRLSVSQLMELEIEEVKRREAEYEEIRKQRESVSDILSQNSQDEVEHEPGSPRLPTTPPPDSPRSQPYGGATQKRDDTWDKMLV